MTVVEPPSVRSGAGLVLGDARARLFALRSETGRVRSATREVALPPGVVRCGEIRDVEGLIAALRPLAAAADGLPVWLGIGPDDAIAQTFDVTGIEPGDVEPCLAELVAGFVEHGYVGGWEIGDGAEGTRALVAACPADHVHCAVDAASRAGVSVAGVELSALALARVTAGAGAGVAIADVGGARSALAWLDGALSISGWLGPPRAGRSVREGRYLASRSLLASIAGPDEPGILDGRAGWPIERGFPHGVAAAIERIAAATVREPMIASFKAGVRSSWPALAGLDVDDRDAIGLGLALVALEVADPVVDLRAATGLAPLPPSEPDLGTATPHPSSRAEHDRADPLRAQAPAPAPGSAASLTPRPAPISGRAERSNRAGPLAEDREAMLRRRHRLVALATAAALTTAAVAGSRTARDPEAPAPMDQSGEMTGADAAGR